jgi:hypothetical protein
MDYNLSIVQKEDNIILSIAGHNTGRSGGGAASVVFEHYVSCSEGLGSTYKQLLSDRSYAALGISLYSLL